MRRCAACRATSSARCKRRSHASASRAPIYLSQNDGTLISTDYATRFPIVTCSAGPTNSIRGAAFLTSMQDAIVIDIGGTTSDFGFLVRGFPRETATAHLIGGVRTNFRMPDVLSIALGGGTLVRFDGDTPRLGPDSVGYQLGERALVFGGSELTTTDIAVRAGQAAIGDPQRVQHIEQRKVDAVLDAIHRAARRRDRSDEDEQQAGAGHPGRRRARARLAPAARRLGRSIARSTRKSRTRSAPRSRSSAVASTRSTTSRRSVAMRRSRRRSRKRGSAALAAGAAADRVEVVDVVELPMTHMRTGAVQVKVRAVGRLAAA